MKRKDKIGWFLFTTLAIVLSLLGCFLIRTDGQLAVLWASVMTIMLVVAVKVIRLRLARYTRREALRNQENWTPLTSKDEKVVETDKKYREFHEHITRTEQLLQDLAIVIVTSLIIITAFHKGPKVIFMITEILNNH